ncbi:MAG: hypothetical protein ABI720_06855 [Actinomycetes bacterium]
MAGRVRLAQQVAADTDAHAYAAALMTHSVTATEDSNGHQGHDKFIGPGR